MDELKLRLTRLYERTARNGNTYFVGYMGSVKLLVFKSRDVGDDGLPIWDVFVQERPEKPKPAEAAALPLTYQKN